MKIKQRYFTILLLLLASWSFRVSGQETFTLNGKITDAATGENLIGVTIYVEEAQTGTTTNTYGFYSISLPAGTYRVRYSYIGYLPEEKTIALRQRRTANLELTPHDVEVGEVLISAERRDKNITSPEIGVERLSIKQLEEIPVIFGEKDILKTIQLLPGISMTSEGSTGFNVRGGAMDQNLILLDEAPVYSASHLVGFFSVFNADALKEVSIYKGGIPAVFGGRASSVLDVQMKDGNRKKLSGSGGIGLISMKMTLEGPLSDRMSFLVSGRRTYADWVAKALFPDRMVSNDLSLYFFDLNAKVNYQLDDRNRIFLSGYLGRDVFGFTNMGTSWGNITGTLRWNHLFGEKLFSNSSLIYSNYDYAFRFEQNDLKMSSGIEDFNFKEDLTWYPNPRNTLKFGLNLARHTFQPGQLTSGRNSNLEIILEKMQAYESGLYLQNEHRLGEKVSASYGIRLSAFHQVGPGSALRFNEQNRVTDSLWYKKGKIMQEYYTAEPRFSLNYRTSLASSAKISWNRMAQYLHLLSNSTSGSPTDIWIPSSNNIKPLIIDQLSGGYFHNFAENSIESSVELYYKKMEQVTDYEDGADLVLNKYIESQILTGKGRSYGAEFYLKKKLGGFTGWISYTLSRTENKIGGINQFRWYPAKYDKTHDVSVVAGYRLTPRLTLSGVWVYATGNAVTFPSGKYVVDNQQVPYYTERNGYRMPGYHRMDVSLTLTGKRTRKVESGWDFSVYNLYNRYNAYAIRFRESETAPGTTEAVRLSLFGIVPSVTYHFKF